MHQSQTSGGDSWFPRRMGYTGTMHGGRAADRVPGRQFMADEHTPGNQTTLPPPPPPAPPPAWQGGAPGPAAGGAPPVAAPARPAVGRRPFLLAAATGAVVGGLVAGLVVAAVKDHKTASPGRSLTFSANTSK